MALATGGAWAGVGSTGRASPIPVAPLEGQRTPLRCDAPADDLDLSRLCDALVHGPNLADGVAVRIEPLTRATDPAAAVASDLLGLSREGDDLLLSLRRPQTRRTLVNRLPALLIEPPRAQAEAFRLALAYLLDAPAEAGQPWPEGADERTPLTSARRDVRRLPPVGGVPAPAPERLRDLFGPTPHPLRPPLVVPGPAPAPRPGHASVDLVIDAPGEGLRARLAPEPRFDARNAPRIWVGLAGLAGAEFEAGFTAGLAHPLHGPWHLRLSSTMAPFGEVGGGPFTAFATLLALEYLLPVRAVRVRIHSGIEHRATLPQWADAQVEGRHRIAGAVGATLETSIGGPLALALDIDASLATGPTRARGINGDRVEGPLTGRTALLVVWTL